ncbi:MAG: PEGA domain-containing protein [Bryobacteraceae bacterium]
MGVYRSAIIIAGLAATLLAQSTGTLKTKVSPSRAGVFVDGKYVGPAGNLGMARSYPVAAGEHEIKLVEPRYQEVVKKVTIAAGKTTTLSETMTKLPEPKPPFGVLRIQSSDKFAAVYVNGRFMGHADEFNGGTQRLLLPPGEYTVRVEAAGGPTEQKVTLEANKTATVQAK